MKKLFTVLGIAAIVLVCMAIFKDTIIKFVVTSAASRMIGAPVGMDSFSIDIFNSTIRITGFKIDNPSGFPQGTLISCPKINVIYDRGSLIRQKPHFLLVDIEIKDMVITKNREGKLNVDSLAIAQPSKSTPSTPMKIDLLNLSIGQIVYEDYTAGTKPSVKVYDVNRHKSYKSVPTAQQLALLVLSEPMKAAAIKDAAIYGVAMLTGVAILPVAVAATFASKDSVRQTLNAGIDHVYEISLEVLKSMGTITKQDEANGEIKANVHGSMVALVLKKSAGNKTEITISARKYLFPQLEVAGGVLYQIVDKL